MAVTYWFGNAGREGSALLEALLASVCLYSQQLRWEPLPFFTLPCNSAVFWGGKSICTTLCFAFAIASLCCLPNKNEVSLPGNAVTWMCWSHLNLSLSQGVFYFPSECLNPFIYFLLAFPLPFLLWPRKLSSPPQHLVSASKHVLTLTSFSLKHFSSFTVPSHQV